VAQIVRRVLLLAIAAVALNACRTLAPPTAAIDLGLTAEWPQRRLLLQSLRRFECSGRVAVAAGGQGFNAQFVWRQTGDDAELMLQGPLGVGGLIVRSSAGKLALQSTDGRRLDGEAARAEMEQVIGTPLPVAALGYWMLGVAQPGTVANESLAATVAGQPAQLSVFEQAGWRVEYQPHASMPRQLSLTSAGARLRLVIEKWSWQ
jgi:outer membrane lipoprotein LolB